MEVEDRGHIMRYGSDAVMTKLGKKHGQRFIEYRQMWEDAGKKLVPPEYPLYIAIAVNSDCNLRCKMCARAYDNSMNNKHQNMSMEMLDEIVRQCADFRCPSILIGQEAECLLHPQIAEIIKKIKSFEPIDFLLITNGTLLNEKMSRLLIEEDIDRLQISIDAAKEETYKTIRGGDLTRLESNINNFLELRRLANQETPLLRVSFCKQKDNAGEEKDFLLKWENKADIVDLQDYIDLSHTGDLADKKYTEYYCPDPFQRLVLDFNGDIYACCCIGYNKYFKLGNLNSMSILEAWNGEVITKLRNSFKNQNLYKACLNCRANRIHG